MEVRVTVTVDVDWCDEDLGVPGRGDPLEAQLCDSVEEAVLNALRHRQMDGFSHDMEALVSILVGDAKAEIVRG
jgi:hypothetical protein